MALARSSRPSFCNRGTTPGMSDSPTINSGRLPSSNRVTSMPFMTSSDASVAPDGPLPMIPTFLTAIFVVVRNFVYDLVTMENYRFFPFRQANPDVEKLLVAVRALRELRRPAQRRGGGVFRVPTV